jgi:hypothetical protein
MKLYGYGEDALTLWALKTKLPEILEALKDNSPLSDCELFFRPSFGRRGGENSSQFGEFDFIILAKNCLYLGESKWDGSPEIKDDGTIELRKEQINRHRLFEFYVTHWDSAKYSNWEEFYKAADLVRKQENIKKPLAPANRLLSKNLQTILGIIESHFSHHTPETINVLLYLYSSPEKKLSSDRVKNIADFKIIQIKYPESDPDKGNYITIEI